MIDKNKKELLRDEYMEYLPGEVDWAYGKTVSHAVTKDKPDKKLVKAICGADAVRTTSWMSYRHQSRFFVSRYSKPNPSNPDDHCKNCLTKLGQSPARIRERLDNLDAKYEQVTEEYLQEWNKFLNDEEYRRKIIEQQLEKAKEQEEETLLDLSMKYLKDIANE